MKHPMLLMAALNIVYLVFIAVFQPKFDGPIAVVGTILLIISIYLCLLGYQNLTDRPSKCGKCSSTNILGSKNVYHCLNCGEIRE